MTWNQANKIYTVIIVLNKQASQTLNRKKIAASNWHNVLWENLTSNTPQNNNTTTNWAN